jgi:hydrogenase maturation protease
MCLDAAAEVLVVGYGNTLRSDDGFGPAVADCLRARFSDPRVRVLTRQLLSLDLVTDLEQSELCVFVDATTVGQVGKLVIRQIAPEFSDIGMLGHELSAASLLGLTQLLARRSPRCVLVSIVPETLALGEHLSDRIAQLIDVAAAEIVATVEQHFASQPSVGQASGVDG